MEFAVEAIISGFVSKVINNCVDFSWSNIKRAVENKAGKHQNIESQIYNVTVDAFNQITSNQYKNDQDKIYVAAEKLLTGYKGIKGNDAEVIKSGLRLLCPYVDNDKCIEFKEILYHVLSKDEYKCLYREIRLLQVEQESKKTDRIEQKVDEISKKLDDRKNDGGQHNTIQNNDIQCRVKSRTQEYADKWNSNMFLNDFDKRDENAGVNVKLSEVYLKEHLPHYIFGSNKKASIDLNNLLSEYIENKIDNQMLLILGQPGIGKSTLITWITANFISRVDDIMVYQFATDLKDIDWESHNISDAILKKIGLSYNDLTGKTLILDGFDEVSVGGNRKEVLDQLYGDLIYKSANRKRFTLIITCRVNYIRGFERVKCKYITLQPWDEKQIQSFCAIFQEKTKCDLCKHTMTRIIKSKDILGIPLILYMVLALNISVEKEGSIVDIYDKIFSLKGGIYDRCIENKYFANSHRIGEIKVQIHQISREIAIWMFENEPDKAYISRNKFEKICDDIMNGQEQNNQEIRQDILIGNYFKTVKHCEGIETEELYFVHRSIYEYFVAETIYSAIEKAMITLSDESQEELAANIPIYLKQGHITKTIGEYLQFKIIKLYNSLGSEKKAEFYLWWETAVEKMMNVGMFYYTNKNIQEYCDIISKEAICFTNFIEILRLLQSTGTKKYILQDVNIIRMEKYIRLTLSDFSDKEKAVDLSKLSLMNLNLVGVDFGQANLKYTDLSSADLRGAILDRANFAGTKLDGSVWFESDVWHLYSPLKSAFFKTLQIDKGKKTERLIRSDLYPYG